MRMLLVSLLVTATALSLGALDASAKPRRHVVPQYVDDTTHELPLTVNKRSWLDPGPVAPVGTTNNYVSANTIFNKTPDQVFAPSKFGNEALPGQPYVPGRTVPIVEFATGPRFGDFYAEPVVGVAAGRPYASSPN